MRSRAERNETETSGAKGNEYHCISDGMRHRSIDRKKNQRQVRGNKRYRNAMTQGVQRHLEGVESRATFIS